MNSIFQFCFLLSQILVGLLSHFAVASNYNTLVYKSCSNQTFADSTDSLSKALYSLLYELLPHSSNSKFFKATSGDDNKGVSGHFQCRGDLSNNDCYDCINSLPELSNSLCNNAVAGRIQLQGCYFDYETDEWNINMTVQYELLNKICGEKAEGFGFEGLRDKAFAAIESGVIEGHGFYSGGYESVNALAQCEGDLGICDCGECVSNAVQIAREECIGSSSGQIYLDRCFISYSYHPQGVPAGNSNKDHARSGNHTGKSVAIVIGGAAALGFGFIFLMYLKSCGKKDGIW